jgi:penicillin-binding protein 1C
MTISTDDKYRLFTPLNEISEEFIDSVLLYEDRYFYYHLGFNPFSLTKAFWESYVLKNRKIGASTITMQLARILYDIDSRSVKGKLYQIVKATGLELMYSKEDILEAYLNLVPYGYNIEGIGAASSIYFNKKPSDLDLITSLNMVAIPQNPNKRVLKDKKHKAMKIKLLKKLAKKYHEYKDKESLVSAELKIEKKISFNAPHFTDFLMKEYRYKNKFHTTLDLDKQFLVEDILERYIDKNKHKGIVNASSLLINWKTMNVEAYVGSASYFNDQIEGQVNAITSRRSPGSSFKTFIYGLAAEQGIIHPMTLLKDSPVRYSNYAPDNFDNKFMGPVFAKDALIYSRNVPAVNLTRELNERSFYDFLKDAKIKSLREEGHYGVALALGAFEASLEEVAKLYAMLRNYGVVKKISYLKEEDRQEEDYKIMTPEGAFIALDMLKENPRPSKINKRILKLNENYEIYWKTGTSHAFRDAWSSGVFGPYVLVVWVGNFNSVGNNAFVGRGAAAPLFFDIVDILGKREKNLSDYPLEPGLFNLTKVDVCEITGDLPNAFCPKVTESWFIPGVSPIKISNIHRKVFIDIETGLRACDNNQSATQGEVYEFWPSDIRSLFESAGIYKKTPPQFMPECSLVDMISRGISPKIFFPVSNILYVIKQDSGGGGIPLKAVVDNDVNKVFWFIDDSFVGESQSNETIYWEKPESGNFIVKVVDERGRVNSTLLKVIVGQ